MTRRSAILASLCAAMQSSAQVLVTDKADDTYFAIEFPKGPRHTGYANCAPVPGYPGMLGCDEEKSPEPKYALIIKYGDRIAKITADEILDALDGQAHFTAIQG